MYINSVFDHHAGPNRVSTLREAVTDDFVSLQGKYANVCRLTATNLSPEDYSQMRERYSRLDCRFNLPSRRFVANELIWKLTEATGKYVGCQFWSVAAKELFDLQAKVSGGWPITAKLGKSIGKKLSMKCRSDESKLTHEHVYPIKDMKRWLSHPGDRDREEIRNYFERQCVSCVLLESEHKLIAGTAGTDENPWLRYKQADIYLSPNPVWSPTQLTLILEATVLRNLG